MSELLLDSLEIKGYRCFEHLTIEKLGRVNLIVGKNNVGKTALLEALWILVNKEQDFTRILQRRDETGKEESEKLNLFSRTSLPKVTNQFFIKTSNKHYLIEFRDRKFSTKTNIVKVRSNIFIEVDGIKPDFIKQYWDSIELTTKEDTVIESMRLLLPNLLRVRPKNTEQTKIPFVQIEGFDKPLPLKSFGDGLNRLFGISLALANCKDGMLLIDEIESGFHYSILPDVWKLIFKTAKDLNVQVFATTHSKDCIEAFTQAAIDDEESEGMLIRLERNKDDKIIAKTIEEENLALAIDYGAEVR